MRCGQNTKVLPKHPGPSDGDQILANHTVSNGNTDLRNKPLAFGWGSQFCKKQSSWPIVARLWIRAIVSAGNHDLGKTNSGSFG